jgi:hypothetical protein
MFYSLLLFFFVDRFFFRSSIYSQNGLVFTQWSALGGSARVGSHQIHSSGYRSRSHVDVEHCAHVKNPSNVETIKNGVQFVFSILKS